MNIDPSSADALQPVPHRPVPAFQCYLAYVSALVVGVVVYRFLRASQLLQDPFWIGLTVSSICTIVIWVFSISNSNSSIYDPYWVIAPPLLAVALKATGNGGITGIWTMRHILIVASLCLWAARYHIFYGWDGWRTGLVHEDWRYESMRSVPVPYWINSLFGMHLFPTVLVYFAFAPAALSLLDSHAINSAMSIWDFLGLAGALTAITIEFIADRQLRTFRLSKSYDDARTLRKGLWAVSRHPNYFGEVLFWLSMIPFAIASGVFAAKPFLTLSGPIVMAIFFRFSSWLMDMRSLDRRPNYRNVMNEVSAMVPWWPRSARRTQQA